MKQFYGCKRVFFFSHLGRASLIMVRKITQVSTQSKSKRQTKARCQALTRITGKANNDSIFRTHLKAFLQSKCDLVYRVPLLFACICHLSLYAASSKVSPDTKNVKYIQHQQSSIKTFHVHTGKLILPVPFKGVLDAHICT